MAKTRGSLIGGRGCGRGHGSGRGRGRGKESGVQNDRAELVKLANISTRSRAFVWESSLSLTSVGNGRNELPNA